jgi:hypothetical protein
MILSFDQSVAPNNSPLVPYSTVALHIELMLPASPAPTTSTP